MKKALEKKLMEQQSLELARPEAKSLEGLVSELAQTVDRHTVILEALAKTWAVVV